MYLDVEKGALARAVVGTRRGAFDNARRHVRHDVVIKAVRFGERKAPALQLIQ